jgi:hypothetical protein
MKPVEHTKSRWRSHGDGMPFATATAVANKQALTANGQAANKANACGTLAPLSIELAANGQTARLSVRNAPAGKPWLLYVRMAVRTPRTPSKTAPNQIPEFSLYWSLTPKVSGAGRSAASAGHQHWP